MKTSAILGSFLLSALAAALPLDKRDLVTKTETVFETLVVYTTVWDDEVPAATSVAAKPTTQPALFFERPRPSTPAAQPTSVFTPPPVQYTPPAPKETPSSSPAPVPTTTAAAPPPPPPSPAPPAPEKPSTTVAPYVPPAVPTKEPESTTPVAPPALPTITPPKQAQPVPAPNSGSGSGQKYTGEMTIYNPAGELGACGKRLSDDEFIVALGAPTMGPSTYNVMTGEATNPWCGKSIQITYQGKTAVGRIEDKCPGCAAGDIDLSPALWKELTGMDPSLGGRFKAEWVPL